MDKHPDVRDDWNNFMRQLGTKAAQAQPPIRVEDSARISLKLASALDGGYRLLIVSHSQGNFMSNEGYARQSEFERSILIRQVHVAPPTIAPFDGKDRKVLADNDVIMAAAGGIAIPNTHNECANDWTSHTFDCYLSTAHSFSLIKDYMQIGSQEIRKPAP